MKKLGYRREENTLAEDIKSDNGIIKDVKGTVSIDVQRMIGKLLQKKYRRTKG